MKSAYIFIVFAVIAGIFMPIQAGLNVKLGKAIGSPIYAALISFIVGTIGLLIYALITKVDFSQISNAGSVSWTVWIAGLFGAFYVTSVIVLSPKIGVALTFILIIAGQLIMSLILDHYGLLGFPVHAINWQRILGILLVVGGAILIRNF